MKQKRRKKIETFDIINICILTVLMFVVLIPFYLTIVQSFMTQQEYIMNGNTLWPKEPTLGNYRDIFVGSTMIRSFWNSVFYTVVGVIFSMVITTTLAYGLSKKGYPGRGFFQNMVIFTMYFSGGIIPTFLVVKNLGMYDSLSSLYIPQAINVFNFIVMRTFFRQLPESLEEAAKIDGASDMGVPLKIVLPLSVPIIATIGLFYAGDPEKAFAVGCQTASLTHGSPEAYLSTATLSAMIASLAAGKEISAALGGALRILQVRLRSLLFADELNNAGGGNVEGIGTQVMTQSLKMACVAVSTIPILLVYPWLQKYFVKGVMLGSVKG